MLIVAAVFSIAATGIFASSALMGQQYPSLAFGQEELGISDSPTDTATTTTTTTDNSTRGTTIAGDIGTTGTTATGGEAAPIDLQVLLLVCSLHQTV